MAAWLDSRIAAAQPELQVYTRNKALVQIGFWRGFRSDELSRLQVEHVTVEPGLGMTIFLPRTNTDRNHVGTTYRAPVLSLLCPVAAAIKKSRGDIVAARVEWQQLQARTDVAGAAEARIGPGPFRELTNREGVEPVSLPNLVLPPRSPTRLVAPSARTPYARVPGRALGSMLDSQQPCACNS